MAKLILILLCSFLFTIPYHAAQKKNSNYVAFDRVLHQKGFSHRTVKCFVQDKRGFIWFGTSDGLYRFDGISWFEYKHDPDNPASISYNNISSMCLDKKGRLWIGTEGGLDQFDSTMERFKHYKHKENDPQSLSSNKVRCISEDSDGSLWIGTYGGGLNHLAPETGEITRYQSSKQCTDCLSSNNVYSICIDFKGTLWIGTPKGLNRLEPHSQTFIKYIPRENDPYSISHEQIRIVYEDRRKEIWVGTWDGGLNKYIRKEDRFKHFSGTIGDQTDLSKLRIKAIYEDRNGSLWIGTRGNGLLRLLRDEKKFEVFKPNPYNLRSLSNDKVEAIYEDNNNILWIGTIGGGINTYNYRKEKFVYYHSTPGRKNSLSNNSVLSIYEAPEEAGKVLWLGTYAGLNRFDRKTNHFNQYQEESNKAGLGSYKVRCIWKDKKGILWLGTDNGLVFFDQKTETFSLNSKITNNLHNLRGDVVIRTIHEDKKGRLWICTTEGLYLLNPGTQKFFQFTHDNDDDESISTNNVFCIYDQLIGDKLIIWVGTYNGGLNKFDPERNKFIHYEVDPMDKGALKDNTIRAIYEDIEGSLWLATEGGLHKFDTEAEVFYVYSQKEVVSGTRIYGILGEDNRTLWLSTNLGISKFNMQYETFESFYESYGLHLINFTQNSYWKSNVTGEMFFGGSNGFVSFFPNQLTKNQVPPRLTITKFKLSNEPVSINSNEGILHQSIIETKEIQLDYDDTPFSFEFAALDYTWPVHNQYLYKLEPFEKEWVKAEPLDRRARYTNVGHGTYTFRVRGTNNDGVWCKEEASIKIIISPPYWHTWWFRIIIAIAIILIFLGIHMFRTNRLRKKIAEQDRVQRILKQARDLAEFRLAEIKKLIAAISSILIAVDSKGEITQWNAASETIFKIPSENSVGNHFREVLKYKITPVLLDKMLAKGLGQDNNYENFEIPVKFNSNPAKLLLGVISPIIDKSGQKLGFLLLAEDITDRKEEEFRRNLSQKLESLGIMAANIAHEVKTPLQYIGHNGTFICDSFSGIKEFFQILNQSIEHLQDCGEEETVKEIKKMVEDYDIEYLLEEIPLASDHIVRGVSRLTSIIQAMKEYSHPGRGIKESADVNQLMESTLVLIRNKKKEILGIETNFNDHLPHIPCYPGELCQVFMNLLINAADAVQERREKEEKVQQPFHGVITVDTSMEDGEIVVSVTDNGCGIPNDIRDNIYNPFFTTKEVGKGTGQGLAVAHKIIIERHKGSLDFNSKVGEGTSFHIRLPIKADGN